MELAVMEARDPSIVLSTESFRGRVSAGVVGRDFT